MVKIQKGQAGNFLTADISQRGDILSVEGEGYIDETRFTDKKGNPIPYLYIPVVQERTGEKYELRLGVENQGRIAETLGDDTKDWVGHKIKVTEIKNYPGLNAKGLLLRGVKSSGRQSQVERSDMRADLPLNQMTVRWLEYNEKLIGELIPPEHYSNMPEDVVRELRDSGLVEQVDGYPHLSEEAKEYL